MEQGAISVHQRELCKENSIHISKGNFFISQIFSKLPIRIGILPTYVNK